jgi:hypothetical protein
MLDIFLSYASPDRPRAEALKSWFEEAGWSVWIDRDIRLSEKWEDQIHSELHNARLVVVLWGSAARRSDWVTTEATTALQSNRLLQIHATGLPLLPPFDTIQAVRMQSWSGEPGHSERIKLLTAIANRLGTTLSPKLAAATPEENPTDYRPGVAEALELAFTYCARQVERVRTTRDQLEQGLAPMADFEEIGRCFTAMLALLRTDPALTDDREGVLHRLLDDFLEQLILLVPDPNLVK